jgi:type IV pilus assembly protein PilY1
MLFQRIHLSRCIFLSIAIYTPNYSLAAELSLPDFPLQVTEYVEPNVMLLLDTSGSMATASSSAGQSRMDVIKEIATELIDENKNIRFCLARFRYDQGGKILSECGSSNEAISSMKAAITTLSAFGSTPLAEAYYEVINYFAGSTPKYRNGPSTDNTNNDNTLAVALSGGKYTSPIQYRCQKNYTIVLTDGTPQLDSYFPSFPSKQSGIKDTNIDTFFSEAEGPNGNWDEKDDDGNGGSNNGLYGVYYYLDDMAKYAWDVDLRDTSVAGVGNDITGKSFDDSTNSNEYKKQNLRTYTVDFTSTVPMLQTAAQYGNGWDGTGTYSGDNHYYNASNKAQLKQAFKDAIDQIVDENKTATEPTTNSDRYSTSLRLFQTRFTNTKWTGELLAYKLQGVNNELVLEWTAPGSFPSNWSERVVYSGINGGVPLKWNELTTLQQNTWFGGTQNQHEQRLDYIRGKTAAQIGLSNFRARESLMGDVVNSSPVYVGPPNANSFKYTDLATSYTSFVNTHNGSIPRAEMIYVGANDGMLHGFAVNESGEEKMAFVPSKVMPNLAELSQADYNHKFYVDGSPEVANVNAEFISGSKTWRTILVGGLRRGGQGIYALDITDPARFIDGTPAEIEARASTTFLWEFSDDETLGNASTTDKYSADKDLGYSYSQPQILRLNDGEFYVVLGNGYNSTESDGHKSTDGDAVLYLLNIATGAVVKKISTGHGMAEDPGPNSLGNGFATVFGFDAGTSKEGIVSGRADGKVDYIYAGDLFGNLWKFNLSSKTPSDWDDSSNPPIKLFTAIDAAGKRQAITVQPQAHKLQDGEIIVLFGTGRLLESADKQANNIITRSGNTFYGIADTNTEVQRSELLKQEITEQGVIGDGEYRLVSSKPRTYHKGWFMDLQRPVESGGVVTYQEEGEQVIVAARIIDNVVFFTTRSGDQNACLSPSRTDFLMTLGVRSGAGLNYTIIDTDGNGTIDDADDGPSTASTKGEKLSGRTGFGSQLPVTIGDDEANDGTKKGYICDAERCYKMQSGAKVWNRTSWKEIRTD